MFSFSLLLSFIEALICTFPNTFISLFGWRLTRCENSIKPLIDCMKMSNSDTVNQDDRSFGKSDPNKSDDKLNGQKDGHQISKNLCWDFIQGICHRKYCRYSHTLTPDQMKFCRDYQNSTCTRNSCKFLHLTIYEEEYFRKTGKLETFQNQLSNDEYMGSNAHQLIRGGRDPLMHQHQAQQQQQFASVIPAVQMPVPPLSSQNPLLLQYALPPIYRYNQTYGCFDSTPTQQYDLKRPATGSEIGQFKRFCDDTSPKATQKIDCSIMWRRFEEEMIMLRRRIELSEIKIAELRASNDYLIAQNQLRITTSTMHQCSRVVNPVTNTTVQQPQQTAQVLNAVSIASIAPVQLQATPIVTMAAPQTQIIASSSCPPIAITANTSQEQQIALTQQDTQILGTSQITLTPTIAPAPSMGLPINTSQALATSYATQPIISYPVMTHSILPH